MPIFDFRSWVTKDNAGLKAKINFVSLALQVALKGRLFAGASVIREYPVSYQSSAENPSAQAGYVKF